MVIITRSKAAAAAEEAAAAAADPQEGTSSQQRTGPSEKRGKIKRKTVSRRRCKGTAQTRPVAVGRVKRRDRCGQGRMMVTTHPASPTPEEETAPEPEPEPEPEPAIPLAPAPAPAPAAAPAIEPPPVPVIIPAPAPAPAIAVVPALAPAPPCARLLTQRLPNKRLHQRKPGNTRKTKRGTSSLVTLSVTSNMRAKPGPSWGTI
ncbi:uncharacterized protein RHO17_004180 [Thomomys bottae]